MRLISKLVIAGFVFLLLSLLIIAFWMQSVVSKPLNNVASEVFMVEPGDSAIRVGQRLAERGLLEHPEVFSWWVRVGGEAGSIKTGEYEITPGLSASGLLSKMINGDVLLHPITFVEGWTWRELRDALQSSDVLRVELNYESAETLAAGLQLGWPHAEGQLFPDTYMVARGTTDRQLLRRAAALMKRELNSAWEGRATGLPLSDEYELLTLASIIERETSLDSERARVAGVFIRRLQKPMRLQTDPTVIYGLGDSFDGNLTRKHLRTDTPYNTYTRAGLPPTPIAMPGAASLRAAANPADGDELYFVASEELDGSHVFSATLDEHNAAVAAYVASLRRARRAGEL